MRYIILTLLLLTACSHAIVSTNQTVSNQTNQTVTTTNSTSNLTASNTSDSSDAILDPHAFRIAVDPEHQQCVFDDDCTYVKTLCGGCECYGTTVNKEYKAQYESQYRFACTIQPTCAVRCVNKEPKCVDNRCI